MKIRFWGENSMNLAKVVGGVVVTICGIILIIYTALIEEQTLTNAMIFWGISIILIIIGAYIAGTELKTWEI